MSDTDLNSICVVGFGYIGCTLGAVLASRGYRVVGVDTSPRILEAVRAGKSPFAEPGLPEMISEVVAEGRLTVTDSPEGVAGTDVVIVAVGTPLSETGDADLSQITSACEAIAPHLSDDQLVVFKSTLPPGVTARVAAPILRRNANVLVAFSPERLAEGRAIEELLTIPIVVGGVDTESTDAAMRFWQDAVGVEVLPVGSSSAAELVKLADNLWIDLNIALANELAKLADTLEYEIDILEVIRAANTLPKGQNNVNILTPSMGVGGYCLTKDPWFVAGVAQKHGIELKTPVTSRNVNDTMPAYTVSRIKSFFEERGQPLSEIKIAVLGLAFKTNTGDCRFTPVKPVLDMLADEGVGEQQVFDPWVTGDDAKEMGIELSDNLDDALEDADCVAFFTGHDEFKSVTPEILEARMKPNGLVLDGRIFFSREVIADIEGRGLTYRGIGR